MSTLPMRVVLICTVAGVLAAMAVNAQSPSPAVKKTTPQKSSSPQAPAKSSPQKASSSGSAAAHKTGAGTTTSHTNSAAHKTGTATAASSTAHKPGATTSASPAARKPGAPAAASSTRAGARTAASRNTKKTPPPPPATWRTRQTQPTPERYREIQNALAAKGYLHPEQVSGSWDQNSVEAMKKFQAEQKLDASGKVNSMSLIALGLGPKHESTALPPPPAGPQQ